MTFENILEYVEFRLVYPPLPWKKKMNEELWIGKREWEPKILKTSAYPLEHIFLQEPPPLSSSFYSSFHKRISPCILLRAWSPNPDNGLPSMWPYSHILCGRIMRWLFPNDTAIVRSTSDFQPELFLHLNSSSRRIGEFLALGAQIPCEFKRESASEKPFKKWLQFRFESNVIPLHSCCSFDK